MSSPAKQPRIGRGFDMARSLAVATVLASSVLGIACSSGDPAVPSPSSGASGTSGTSSGTSGSSSGTSGTSGSSGTPAEGVPTDAAGMNAFLQKRGYAGWGKESAAHPSTGPHGASVLTYISPTLDTSLASAATEHPKGAAAVKEFYSGGQVTGWAAYVKTQPASAAGQGWYWYEVFSTTPGASAIEGQGHPTCTGCHSSGRDYVRIPYPLQ